MVAPTDDLRAYRMALGSFATGVTVVACRDGDGEPRGFTANSFTSVSLSPPLVLVCIGETAASFGAFRETESFSINILAEHQRELSNLFASKRPDKFDHAPWRPGDTGAPVFTEALTSLECRTHQIVTAGDHIILIGEVVDMATLSQASPLVYFRGAYVPLAQTERALESAATVPAVVGAVSDWQGRILLCRRAGAPHWELPNSRTRPGDRGGRAALVSLIEATGALMALQMPYSVFEAEGDGALWIVYRALMKRPPTVEEVDGIAFRLFAAEEIPWGEVRADLFETMLRRYLREQVTARFALYADAGETRLGVLAVGDRSMCELPDR